MYKVWGRVPSELNEEQQGDYKTAKAKEELIKKMAPMGFTSIVGFQQRKLHLGEALPLYVHKLKKLLEHAMPGLDDSACEQLLLHQFLAGLPVAVSGQIRAAGDTTKLDTTVERARILMAIDDDEKVATAVAMPESRDVQELKEQISQLTEHLRRKLCSGPKAHNNAPSPSVSVATKSGICSTIAPTAAVVSPVARRDTWPDFVSSRETSSSVTRHKCVKLRAHKQVPASVVLFCLLLYSSFSVSVYVTEICEKGPNPAKIKNRVSHTTL